MLHRPQTLLNLHLHQTYAKHAFFTILHCVFLNASSNCMQYRLHTDIDCIYLTFFHCEFSNESSNCLPNRMHTHIGCTCSTFSSFLLSLQLLYWSFFAVQNFHPSPTDEKQCCLLLFILFQTEKKNHDKLEHFLLGRQKWRVKLTKL